MTSHDFTFFTIFTILFIDILLNFITVYEYHDIYSIGRPVLSENIHYLCHIDV